LPTKQQQSPAHEGEKSRGGDRDRGRGRGRDDSNDYDYDYANSKDIEDSDRDDGLSPDEVKVGDGRDEDDDREHHESMNQRLDGIEDRLISCIERLQQAKETEVRHLSLTHLFTMTLYVSLYIYFYFYLDLFSSLLTYLLAPPLLSVTGLHFLFFFLWYQLNIFLAIAVHTI